MHQDTVGTTTAGPGRRQRLAGLSQRAGLLPVFRSARALLRDDLRILAYHRVLPPTGPDFSFDMELVSASAERFREQMQLLRRRFHPMRFDEVLAAIDAGRRLPRNAVLVTFDDGYDDNYHVAWPILHELGLSAMFFVSTGHIDSGAPFLYDWLVHMVCVTDADRIELPELRLQRVLPVERDERRELAAQVLDRLKALDDVGQARVIARLAREWRLPIPRRHDQCRPMTWSQLREMHEDGMEVGSHGVHHRMLAKLPPAQMRAELVESWRRIRAELGRAPTVVSYPVGGFDGYNREVETAARAAGYEMGCSYVAGTSRPGRDVLFSLRRLPIERHMDMAWFEATLALPELFVHPSRQRAPMRPA